MRTAVVLRLKIGPFGMVLLYREHVTETVRI